MRSPLGCRHTTAKYFYHLLETKRFSYFVSFTLFSNPRVAVIITPILFIEAGLREKCSNFMFSQTECSLFVDSTAHAFSSVTALSSHPLILTLSCEHTEWFYLMDIRMPQGCGYRKLHSRDKWASSVACRQEGDHVAEILLALFFSESYTFSSYQNPVVSIWVVDIFGKAGGNIPKVWGGGTSTLERFLFC